MPRIFYRSVKNNPPIERDFLSPMAIGRKPRSTTPEFLRKWGAVSVFTTAVAARANAEYYDLKPGEYIAEIQIPDGVLFEHDGPDEVGHCDLYGTQPHVLLGYVTAVVHYTAVPESTPST